MRQSRTRENKRFGWSPRSWCEDKLCDVDPEIAKCLQVSTLKQLRTTLFTPPSNWNLPEAEFQVCGNSFESREPFATARRLKVDDKYGTRPDLRSIFLDKGKDNAVFTNRYHW